MLVGEDASVSKHQELISVRRRAVQSYTLPILSVAMPDAEKPTEFADCDGRDRFLGRKNRRNRLGTAPPFFSGSDSTSCEFDPRLGH
jgi:hypothetical protein